MRTILYQWGDLEAQRLKKEHPYWTFVEWAPGRAFPYESFDRPFPQNAVGSIEWTRALFDLFRWKVKPVGGPNCIVHRALMNRVSVYSTLGHAQSGNFVKPLPENMKVWTGEVCDSQRLEELISQFGPEFECEEQLPMRFHNEWRLFFAGKPRSFQLAGGAAYPVPEDGPRILSTMLRGRSMDMPSFELESFIINTLNGLEIYGIPDGLVVDVGQDENDKWHVIEVGDCWAMGSYGAGAAYLWTQEFRFSQLSQESIRNRK